MYLIRNIVNEVTNTMLLRDFRVPNIWNMKKKTQKAPEKNAPKKLDRRIRKICNKLKEIRIEKGYTSYENFAWDNDLPRVQYWRLENGVNFRMESLLRILDVHKIKLEDFFKGIK